MSYFKFKYRNMGRVSTPWIKSQAVITYHNHGVIVCDFSDNTVQDVINFTRLHSEHIIDVKGNTVTLDDGILLSDITL